MRNNLDWEAIAKSLLYKEQLLKPGMYPEPTGVLVTWKGDTYIGTIQAIAPEFSADILLLSKSSKPLQKELVESIKKIDKRLELYGDNTLDLEGRQHIVRKDGNRLTYMRSEQTIYMIKHYPDIIEKKS